jgi:polyisoprenoid-binding protein YceI
MHTKKPLLALLGLFLAGVASAEIVELIPDPVASVIEARMAASPPHSFTGTVNHYQLDLRADTDDGQLTAARFQFDFADFDTQNEKRDRKMHTWMDSALYPEVGFVLTRIENSEAGLVAVGDFTMHGQTRELRLPFTFSGDGKRFTLDTTYSLDHRDWGLPKVRLLIFTVNPVLEINIHLEGTYGAA